MDLTLYRHPFRTMTALAPFYRPSSIMEEIDEIAREFSQRVGFLEHNRWPQTDVYEEKDELVVKAELPGIDEKELEVTLEGDMLTIRAEKKESTPEEATHHTRERYYGKYVRSMSLPYRINGDKVTATFENGILELRMPKADELKPRKIEVKGQLTEGETPKKTRKPRQKKS